MPGKKHNHSRRAIFLLMLLWISAPMLAYSQEPKHETLSDGVIRWYRSQKEQKPWFFRQVEGIFNVLLPNENELPFGKSVAFLVGVSRYGHISPQLPFVKNDLNALREYLLEHGGFDEVYVAADDIVTTRLVEDYIFNQFPTKLGTKDRLLFYYSGHGADFRGNTGYLQFSKVRSAQYDPDQWLAIDRSKEWSKVLPASHVLFIFDCCVSGLAFTKGASDSRAVVLKTLSGNGSRTVITAGTGNEKSLGLKDQRSVFTDAFLNALKNPLHTQEGFVTISQIFAQIESEVKQVAKSKGQIQTPMREDFETGKYRGTFLFIDTSPQNAKLPDDVRISLKAVEKGSIASYGIVHLISFLDGKVYVDDAPVQDIRKGEGIDLDLRTGEHLIEVRAGNKSYRQSVNVKKGENHKVLIRPEISPPTPEPTPVVEVPKKKPAPQKPKYQLRKEPMTVSDEEFKKIFGLKEHKRPLEYVKNDFKDNGDGTITDHATGLMWQKSGSDKHLTYEKAKGYVKNLKLAGYSDWRLPTIDELKSLITENKQSDNLYINPIFEKKKDYNWFWSSDQRASGGAWDVYFNFGDVNWSSLSNDFYVRAVRSLTP